MADAMESENLESKANEPQEDHYRLVTYSSQTLPKEFKPKVLANFLNSLRYGNDLFKLIDKENYYTYYSKYVHLLLTRPTVYVRFALLDDDTILGWCMFEGPVVHYVFVNKDMRNKRIGQELLPNRVDAFTHITNKGINMWLKHFTQARFTPFV